MNAPRSLLTVNCRDCGEQFPSDLNRWVNVYTEGEVWWETCPGCHRRFECELSFKVLVR